MKSLPNCYVIAIDGPAASGKGTLARLIAEHYGFPHLDTGLTYRAVARTLVIEDLPLDNEELAAHAAANIDLAHLDRDLLSAYGIADAASQVAVMPAVRRALVEKQRAFAETPPGAVLDGRDIGTVVCPDADVKLYVTASPQARAERRHAEIPRPAAARACRRCWPGSGGATNATWAAPIPRSSRRRTRTCLTRPKWI